MHFRPTLCLSVLALTASAVALSQTTPAASAPQAPSGPLVVASGSPQAAPAFPPVDPANFTAKSPTRETVEQFLHAFWGYDDTRVWQLQAILPTQAEGVAHVIVLVRSTSGQNKDQTAQLAFFTLPDGKFLVADSLLPFGAKPFQAYRDLLKSGATGPSRGAASKDLEIVEFADFECPHCKDAQPILAKLVTDYPTAHFVYQDFPLAQHSEALKASMHGYCVAKTGGDEAFYKFSDALFNAQAGLTPATSDATLKDAETKAGQDPAKVSACVASPAAKSAVEASMALGAKVGVNSTPTIFVNGRGLPVTGIPYETLRKIIDFQAQLDGIALPGVPAPRPAPSLR
jgi:protein-disulfide isomerase